MSVRNLLLIGFTLACVVAALLLPAIPQSVDYHNFADQRTFWGIEHFNNVASNIGFLLAGSWGLSLLIRNRVQFECSQERWLYLVFFFGIFATAFGSSYYHLAPDNGRLFWDRLPMMITFMALVASQISDRISVRTGVVLSVPMLLIGISSVIYWRVTEEQGMGNVLPYAILQAYTVLALLFLAIMHPSRYSRGRDLYWIFGWYVLSKLFEAYDAEIFSVSHVVSGHTLKHFAASMGGLVACYMLIHRVLKNPARVAEGVLEASPKEPQPSMREFAMRYVYIALIITITAIVLLFKIQNISLITVSLFNMSLTLPASLLMIGIYVLGMFTGSALWALVRGWFQGAARKPE